MSRILRTTLATAAVAATVSASASAETIGGTPITAETLIDRAEMVRIADAIDAAVDAKDWALARSFFTEEVRVDFTSLVGGAPAVIPADALIDGWSANLTAEKTSFHLRGNHRVAFEGKDSATMHSHGYAWNRMEQGASAENGGEALWEVWGTYEHGFSRTADGWRVDAMTFVAVAERGNAFVHNTPGS